VVLPYGICCLFKRALIQLHSAYPLPDYEVTHAFPSVLAYEGVCWRVWWVPILPGLFNVSKCEFSVEKKIQKTLFSLPLKCVSALTDLVSS